MMAVAFAYVQSRPIKIGNLLAPPIDLQSRMWSCASMESALAAMNLPDSKEDLEKCIKETFSVSSTSKKCKWDMIST